MEILKKMLLGKLLLLGLTCTYAMGVSTSQYVPIDMGNGLVTFVPYVKPIIEPKGASTVTIFVGNSYIELGAETIDGREYTTTGTVNNFQPGTYTITYTTKDDTGHSIKTQRYVIVKPLEALLPHDTNLYYAPSNEKGYLYFADPQPSENGKNRVFRVNYATMAFDESKDSVVLTEDAYLLPGKTHSNPHSVDRAGKTNKFYMRTQNAYSFDVVKSQNGKLQYSKTEPLFENIDGTNVQYSPRAFGAYNAKYDIQLLSGRNTSANYSMTGIVDVKTDKVIKHIHRRITGDGSSVTGHATWLDVNHFAVIDRGNHAINVYKIFINSAGKIDARLTNTFDTVGPVHALERVANPKNSRDLNTFYAMGESVHNVTHPFVEKLVFDPDTGRLEGRALSASSNKVIFDKTNYAGLAAKNIAAVTHHSKYTVNGNFIIVPVFDGKIYKVDRETMQIKAIVDTGLEKGLGAGHVSISKLLQLAIITNHWSPYITLIDLSNGGFKLKGYVKIYRDGHHDIYHPDEKHLMQPHFAQLSDDGKYFYTFASQDNGRFVKVNLEEVLKHQVIDNVFQFDNNSNNSNIIKSIDVEGAPEQAHS